MDGVAATPCEYAFPYGGNPHCTTIASCISGTWSLQQPDRSCYTNPTSCPADFDAGNTDMCANVECTYAAGRCTCDDCAAQGPCNRICRARDSGTEWFCFPWDEPPGCPNPRPLLGTACTNVDAGTLCGGLWDEPSVCAGGYWTVPVANGGC